MVIGVGKFTVMINRLYMEHVDIVLATLIL